MMLFDATYDGPDDEGSPQVEKAKPATMQDIMNWI